MGKRSIYGYYHNDWDPQLNWGGPREGAGRPKKWAKPPKVFRLCEDWGEFAKEAQRRTEAVPDSLAVALLETIDEWMDQQGD